MVHLGKMNLGTALLFETVEEIYYRVFREMKPRTSVPTVSIQFRKYANANCKIRLSGGELTVRISDLLQTAPSPVQEALACILLGKLFRRPLDGHVTAVYQRYLDRPDVRERLQLAKQQRGRKIVDSPAGRNYNLREIFAELNERYFGGKLREPLLGWSRRPSRTVFGHYDSAHHAIVLTKLLDSDESSRLLVEYVMFHEMLHIQYPTETRGIRRCIHTTEFKYWERKFESYSEARKAIKTFVKKLPPLS